MARETAIQVAFGTAMRRGNAVYVLLIDGSYFVSAQCDDKLAHRVALIVGVSGVVWAAREDAIG